MTFVIKVLGGNKSSTYQLNSTQQMIVFSLMTRTKINIGKIIYDDLVIKLTEDNRKRTMSYPRFVSLVLEHLLGEEYTQDPKMGIHPHVLSKKIYSKSNPNTEVKLKTYMLNFEQLKQSPPTSL